ncbi:MAG: ATP-grasp domain-containing protein [Mycobacteriales bacterium]
MRTRAAVPTRAAADAAAVLLGDSMDLACTLRAAGARVSVVAGPHAPARFSRHRLRWQLDPRPGDARLVRLLSEHAGRSGPSVLIYENDRDLLFASRHREELADGPRVLLPEHELVEELVDKGAFGRRAEQLGLCVPPGEVLEVDGRPLRPGIRFPVLVKPCFRDRRWIAQAQGQKAFLVHGASELDAFLARLAGSCPAVVLQSYVPGGEHRVESYHVYVDAAGEVAAEFTGRKIRTSPAANGFSTALVTTARTDVRDMGRDAVRALGLVGVAKLDFKRDPDGRLWLLEVNPRFNLWHRLGAAAGVNIPELVMADLLGRPRPSPPAVHPGVAWCHVPKDLLAARAVGIPVTRWVQWARTCDATGGLDLTDPFPFVLGKVAPRLRARLRPRQAVSSPANGAALEPPGVVGV